MYSACRTTLWPQLGYMMSGTPQSWFDTGFHPLDGARYLRLVGVDEVVIGLVAYHSCAPIEAKVRAWMLIWLSSPLPETCC